MPQPRGSDAAWLRALLAALGVLDLVAGAVGNVARTFPFHVASSPWARIAGGLALLLAGGSFPVLLASYEAFRQYGYQRVLESFEVLRAQYRRAADANKKDDAVDDDADGVPDVQQVSHQELLSRKTLLFMRVVNPQQLSDAALSLWLAGTAVLCSVRLKFAQALTFGTAIGEALVSAFLSAGGEKLVQRQLPPELHKWVLPVLGYVARLVGVSIAWSMQRIASALQASIQGGQMLVIGVLDLLQENGVPQLAPNAPISTGSPTVVLLCWLVAACGLLLQVWSGFALPFPLNIALLPAQFFEWSLKQLIALSS